MKAVIFDIDGTLADVRHRLHHLEVNRNWDGFFGDMHLDPPHESVVWLCNTLLAAAQNNRFYANISPDQFAVLIVSARPEQYRTVTETWLKDCLDLPFVLYMRPANDTRPDQIVKAEILEQIINDGYEPWLVIDDRPQVVEMWRSYGITTLQCDPGEENKSKYAGQELLHIVVGPSGAGKSTYIKANYKPQDVVSTDQIRLDFGLWDHTPENLARVWGYTHDVIKARLKQGIFTVLDATNIRRKDRLAIVKLIPQGVFGRYVIIDREFDQKLRDRDWRPEELVKKHHNTFKMNLKDILAGDEQPNIYVSDKREHKL